MLYVYSLPQTQNIYISQPFCYQISLRLGVHFYSSEMNTVKNKLRYTTNINGSLVTTNQSIIEDVFIVNYIQ